MVGKPIVFSSLLKDVNFNDLVCCLQIRLSLKIQSFVRLPSSDAFNYFNVLLPLLLELNEAFSSSVICNSTLMVRNKKCDFFHAFVVCFKQDLMNSMNPNV